MDIIGQGYTHRSLTEAEVGALVARAFGVWNLAGQQVLLVIPDRTRTMPMPLFFRLIREQLSRQTRKLDVLIALGTHPPMSDESLCRHLGLTPEERSTRYADVAIFNHGWERPETFVTLGTISAEETLALSSGRLAIDVPVRVNRLVLDYDLVLVCGPVFPHEVAGFSGGNKYFFPGISGPEVINFTHWLGALMTNYEVIGTKHTPIRQVIDRATSFIPTPKLALCSVVTGGGVHGVYAGKPQAAWSAAADLSAQLHVQYVARPYRQVLAHVPRQYDDLWTGAKGMYKVEPVVADGGEVIIYAPHITEISYTHGRLIDEIGYHVRDYFVKQWARFEGYPWGVLAHSTHVRGIGEYHVASAVEQPRIQVTLATGIPRERCERVCLGYRDPATVRIEDWTGREADGMLYVPHAGETLYRLRVP
jgi:nickel-dependent lactate racemase